MTAPSNSVVKDRRRSVENLTNDVTTYLQHMALNEDKTDDNAINNPSSYSTSMVMPDIEVTYDNLDGIALLSKQKQRTVEDSKSRIVIEGKIRVKGDVQDFVARYVAAVVARALAMYLQQTLERVSFKGSVVATTQVSKQ